MSDELIARTRAALDGVTEGEWSVVYDSCDCGDGMCGHGQYPYAIHGPADHSTLDSDFSDSYKAQYGHQMTEIVGISDADAEFIAASRTLVPDLLEAVIELDATLFQITEARIDYEAALRNREHGGVAADRFIWAVFSALDRHEKTSKTDRSVT